MLDNAGLDGIFFPWVGDFADEGGEMAEEKGGCRHCCRVLIVAIHD